jgi:hypothetical protein
MTESRDLVPGHPRPDLLRLYLQDHLAGSMGGVALARRTAANHRQTPYGAELAALADEIEQDRETLVAIMSRLDVPPDRFKGLAAIAAERLGRLKLNGSLLRRSPLSTLIELEGMELGVRGKAAGWRALRRIADRDPRLQPDQLDTLIARADDQSERFEAIRLRAVVEIFGLSNPE